MSDVDEFAHDFGAVTANTAAQFSIDQTFRGNPNVPNTARIVYAIVRNNTSGSVTVRGPLGPSIVGIGERKRIELHNGVRFFTIIPAATTAAGTLTADIGIRGCRF